jgi:hypothetical protein
MPRKRNMMDSSPIPDLPPEYANGHMLHFEPHERRRLKLNKPGGGLQGMENFLVTGIDANGDIFLDHEKLKRLKHYCGSPSYGSGGPNGRLRDACIPVLRRIGIEVVDLMKKPKRREVSEQEVVS